MFPLGYQPAQQPPPYVSYYTGTGGSQSTPPRWYDVPQLPAGGDTDTGEMMAQQQLVKHAVTYKGKEYEVQEKPEEDLECRICLQLACDPCQTSCCGQTLCFECDRNLPPLKSCPYCRDPDCQVTRDARIKRKIRSLTAYCPNHNEKCSWLGSIVKVNDHLEMSCPEQFICCQFVECTRRVRRKNMADHIEECPAHPMTCPNYCSTEEKLTRSTLQDHLNNNCPEELIFCEYTGCRMLMKRKKMVRHIEKCPAHPMTCPNYCSTEEKLTRSTLQDHLNNNCPEQFIPCHMCSVRLKRKHMAQHMTDHIYEMKQVSLWLFIIALLLILCLFIFRSYMSGFDICITLLSFIAAFLVSIKIS